MARLQRLRVQHFKAFDAFTLNFGANAFLVGPNNAGKSTIISAIRSAAAMLGIARHRRPTLYEEHGGFGVHAHLLVSDNVGLVTENLRHQFREKETTLKLTLSNDVEVTAVWPPPSGTDEDPRAYFYLWRANKSLLRQPKDVRAVSTRIGVIPGLYPINRTEEVLGTDYVKQHYEGRRASQHTRNQVFLLEQEGEFDDFREFVLEWLPEIAELEVERRPGREPGIWELDVFVRERADRIPKELFWAGDGIQVFIQILTHLWRLRDASVVVLDEPDLYLHADLQRRLVRLLESTQSQTVTATHSPEMLAEAPADSVIWVDKSKRRAIRRPDPASLEDMSAQIGSGFNLRLAAALRARTVVFVEGDDMTILRRLAETVGASHLGREQNCTVIPMGGFSRWPNVEPFTWLLNDFLDSSVEVYVILDRDFKSDDSVDEIEASLRDAGVHPHVWRRKELESYLIEPDAIARITGIEPAEIESILENVTADLANMTMARLIADDLDRNRKSGRATPTMIEKSLDDLEGLSHDPRWRLARFPAKEILSGLNRTLAESEARTLSTTSLSKSLRPYEVPTEVTDLFLEIEASIARPGTN